jgi:hypothetical protein
MGLFDGIFGGGTDTSALQTGAADAEDALNKGKGKGLKALGKAEDKYTPRYETAANAFSPYQQTGGAANSMYGNALGLNGQTGYDAALGAFHQGPGFQFALDQANQNVMRNQAATGALNSGGTLTALSDRAQGLQNQEYQTWLDNLFRGGSQGIMGAQGQSQALQALGSQIANTGALKSGVHTGAAGALATNASNLGAGLQGQTAADQASQLSLLTSILGGGASVLGAYAPGKKV